MADVVAATLLEKAGAGAGGVRKRPALSGIL